MESRIVVDLRLPRGWDLSAYAAWAEEDNSGGQYGHVNTTFLNEALGATPPAFAHEALLVGSEGKL